MTNDLTKARQQLGQIRSYLRTGKPLPAIQALHSTLRIALQNPLMKSEKDEFSKLFEDAVLSIMSDPTVKGIYPENITYTPGKELQLLDDVRKLLEAMDSSVRDAVQEAVRQKELRRVQLLKEGEEHFQKAELEKAKSTLSTLARENKDEPELYGQIGDICLKYKEYEEAIKYLEIALRLKPQLVYLYNSIGIALRKTQKFETAEKYYLHAANYLGRDPNLFFNLGRLYVDWKQWEKAIKAAAGALKVKPDFVEAQKLKEYAEKNLYEIPKSKTTKKR